MWSVNNIVQTYPYTIRLKIVTWIFFYSETILQDGAGTLSVPGKVGEEFCRMCSADWNNNTIPLYTDGYASVPSQGSPTNGIECLSATEDIIRAAYVESCLLAHDKPN